jgi:DNA polymerase III subunit delta
LHGMVARVSAGGAIDEVMRSARPPIFFKHQDGMRRQLRQWREPALRSALAYLAEAEIHMKTTGFPAETLCRAALLAVAQRAGCDAARQS